MAKLFFTKEFLLDEIRKSKQKGEPTLALAKVFIHMVYSMGNRSNFSGYSYLEDMQGEGLIQLTKGWMKIDENHPQCNPHAYFSRCIWQAFVKCIKKEHELRAIRDEFLIAGGYDPSFNRQVVHEMDLASEREYADALQPDPRPAKKKPAKPRGRPPRKATEDGRTT